MPLPHSGVGETLSTGAGVPRGGRASAQQETLFGISPEQLRGAVAPKPPPTPAAPVAAARTSAARASAPAPQGSHAGERLVSEPARAGSRPEGAGVPLRGDSPVPQRTLVGVMPDDMAQAIAAAREARNRDARNEVAALPAHLSPRAPSPEASPLRAQPSPRPPPPSPPAYPQRHADVGRSHNLDVARGGGTVVGAPAAALPLPAARVVREPERPAAGAPNGPDPGTVRSISPGATRAATERLAASTLDVDPEPMAAPPGGSASPAPQQARTHLGVAIPGIAPLRAGAGAPPQAARAPSRLEATRLESDAFSIPPASLRAAMPRGAFVLLGSGLVLLIAAAAFALLWKAHKPLSVAISADASGKDRIDLVCEECADGTRVSLDGAIAEVSERKAYLTLPEPLPLGENRVTFGLEQPGKGPEQIELTLPPLDYRIRTDTASLVGDQPRVTLKIAAIAGSKAEIAHQPVALDPQGQGEIAVDLTGQLIGAASDVVTFEQAIPYLITPPSGKVYDGALSVKIGVTPLLLEAPGTDTVTDLERFMLAGRTLEGAELAVAGTTLTVDTNGRFAQLMSIDSVGETRVTVRATAPGLAPRFVSFRLQRVQKLDSEAALRRQKALPLADVRRSIADHVGSTVVVSGRVEEVRIDGHRTLVILATDGDCQGSACLARLVYGGLRKLARGEVVTAIGRLQGSVGTRGSATPAAEVPEIDVSLLL
jgi:hypothetical protein